MNTFAQALESIAKIHKLIQGMTFEQAFEELGGFNKDETLFDFNVDENIIGTIHNNDGMAFMDTNDSFYEYWDGADQLWAMTEEEIREQKERLE